MPQPGDLFVMQLPDMHYLFGRVIRNDALIGPMTDCILIYIYRSRSDSKTPPPPSDLKTGNLLVPPILTNRLPWTKGDFETVDHSPLEDTDQLPQHCFLRSNGDYYDERNNSLPGPVEPVGAWALDSFRTIDDTVSEALGFALASD